MSISEYILVDMSRSDFIWVYLGLSEYIKYIKYVTYEETLRHCFLSHWESNQMILHITYPDS